MKSEEIAKLLRKNDIRPSYPRVRIYKYLCDNRIHPTVDEIYSDLKNELHTLSKTTVYNTLNTFIESDLILSLTIDENNVRYDVDTGKHGHFRCINCEKVYDFDFEKFEIKYKDLDGYEIKSEQLYLTGLCKKCNQ